MSLIHSAKLFKTVLATRWLFPPPISLIVLFIRASVQWPIPASPHGPSASQVIRQVGHDWAGRLQSPLDIPKNRARSHPLPMQAHLDSLSFDFFLCQPTNQPAHQLQLRPSFYVTRCSDFYLSLFIVIVLPKTKFYVKKCLHVLRTQTHTLNANDFTQAEQNRERERNEV